MLRLTINTGSYYRCGRRVEIFKSSGYDENYGRQYWGCGPTKLEGHCGFQFWVDPSHNEEAQKILGICCERKTNWKRNVGKIKEEIEFKRKKMNLKITVVLLVLWVRQMRYEEEVDDLVGLTEYSQYATDVANKMIHEVEMEVNLRKAKEKQLWIAMFALLGLLISVLIVG